MKSKSITKRSLAPNTTAQEDIVTAGQRKINLIWEYTQAAISITLTVAFVYCKIQGIDSTDLIWAFSFVLATYLSRTNHSAIGGIGKKPTEKYMGR